MKPVAVAFKYRKQIKELKTKKPVLIIAGCMSQGSDKPVIALFSNSVTIEKVKAWMLSKENVKEKDFVTLDIDQLRQLSDDRIVAQCFKDFNSWMNTRIARYTCSLKRKIVPQCHCTVTREDQIKQLKKDLLAGRPLTVSPIQQRLKQEVSAYINNRHAQAIQKLIKQMNCAHIWNKYGHGFSCPKCEFYTGMNTNINAKIVKILA